MATLPQMIDAIQKVDGRELSTLTQFGRVIREAGFIPGGKRGVGAPHVTFENAASLMMGIFACEAPKDAPRAIVALRSLKFERAHGDLHNEVLADVIAAENFGEALEELIIGIPELITGIVGEFVGDAASEDEKHRLAVMAATGLSPVSIWVRLFPAHAIIEVRQHHHKMIWEAHFGVDCDLLMQGFYNLPNSDRRVEVSFSQVSLLAVHMAAMSGIPSQQAVA